MIPYGRHSTSYLDAIRVALQVKKKSLTQGSKVTEFENRVAEYVGAKYAVAVSSATAGLHLAVMALELPTGSEIITSPISFVASSNSILYSGHKPIFIDIDKRNVNLNLELISNEAQRNSKIKAVIPVHFAGLPCNMQQLKSITSREGLGVIEDAAHAFGSRYENGAKVGSCSNSDMTVFSFHPVKSITTGEGGIITTNSLGLYRKLLKLRSHGINKLDDQFKNTILSKTLNDTNPWYYEMHNLGFNYRLTDIQSVLGISQLNRIDTFMEKRRKLRTRYVNALRDNEVITPAQNFETDRSANHIFPVRISFSKIKKSRAQIMYELRKRGIGTQVHYMPIPLHPYYQELEYGIQNLPEAMSYYEETLTLPLFPDLSLKNQSRVIKTLHDVIFK